MAARVGLIGFGLAGREFHAPAVAAVDGLVLDAVVTRDPDRAEAVRVQHPQADVVASVEELLARTPDVVVVASPNRHHATHARAAFAAGVGTVVVDKPLAADLATARELVDEAHAAGTRLTVFQNRRWDPDFARLRERIARGELGDVVRFESRFERWRPTLKPGWREHGDPEDGGGLLLDLQSHLVDQAIVLLGPVAHVHAEVETRRPGAQVDDHTFLALTHESGARSHLSATNLAAVPGPRFRVLGTLDAHVQQEHDDASEIGAQAFYAALAAGRTPVEPEDAITVLEVLDAARRG